MMKKLFALLLCLMLLPILPAMAETTDMLVVYASVPDDWSWPCVWAWNAEGANAFAAWPGEQMEPDPANKGWYYLYLPAGMESVIINANGGAVQTADLKDLDPADLWITVAADGSVEVTYDDPTAPKAEDVTIYAKVPDDWTALPRGKAGSPAAPRRRRGRAKPFAAGWAARSAASRRTCPTSRSWALPAFI